MASDEEDDQPYSGTVSENEETDNDELDISETESEVLRECYKRLTDINPLREDDISTIIMASDDEDYYRDSGTDSEDEESNVEPYFEVRRRSYRVLTEEDIKHLQDNDISTVSGALSVPRGVACTLLCRNNWSLKSAYYQWFSAACDADPLPAAAKPELGQQPCSICSDDMAPRNAASAACGHPFCTGCWKTYLKTAIDDGPGCLTLPCPEPGCKAAVGVDMVESLASPAAIDRYYKFLRRSYVDSSRRRKWCPATGCAFAVEMDPGCGRRGFDVTCGCSHKFCWNCTAEHHSPVSCKTVARWTEKISSGEANTTWITAYTKPCPKCRRPIEKDDHGCNYVRCSSPCNFSFCWLCGRSFHHRSCNRFDALRKEESLKMKEKEKAKDDLKRYLHYYDRWFFNEKSRQAAVEDLRRWGEERISDLAEGRLRTVVVEAWEQIVECRRVLKWSYAYGYYMEGESEEKTRFFEHLQGQAETALEKLHHCAETGTEEYLRLRKKGLEDFRAKLAGLTKALEDNLLMRYGDKGIGRRKSN